jgi:PAS domain S-box-containing protein
MATARELTHAFLLGDALEGAAVAALLKDADGRYAAVNAAACELTGYSRDELMTAGADVLSGRTPEELERILAAFRANEPMPGKGPLVRKDGTVIEVAYERIPTSVGGVEWNLFLVRRVE